MIRNPGKVYLVTSGGAGSGRTLIAVTLAICLSRFGKVAFLGDRISERGFFGQGVAVPSWRNCYHPNPAIWQGRNACIYKRENLFFADTSQVELNPGYVDYLRGLFDYVLISSRVDGEGAKSSTSAATEEVVCPIAMEHQRRLSAIVDAAIVVYRHNDMSLDQAAALCSIYQQIGKAVIPVANFLDHQQAQSERIRDVLSAAYEDLVGKVAYMHADLDWLYSVTRFQFADELASGTGNTMRAVSLTSLTTCFQY